MNEFLEPASILAFLTACYAIAAYVSNCLGKAPYTVMEGAKSELPGKKARIKSTL